MSLGMRKFLALLLLMSLLGSLMPVANADEEEDLYAAAEESTSESEEDEDAVDPFEFFANHCKQVLPFPIWGLAYR